MSLDFLVIGAQKSATTALFRYLQPHPEISMPAAKEVPVFDLDRPLSEIEQILGEHFPREGGDLMGKATPQYMGDAQIPERINRYNPDMKLIAVLRDPIDRAWSHYRMNKRREVEHRDFETAMRECLDPEVIGRGRTGRAPSHAAGYESESDYYLAWGEYGRILSHYLKVFPREQLLVLYTSELQQDPARSLDGVLQFLGLEPGFRPDCLGEVIHKGGTEKVLSKETLNIIRDLWPVKQVWQRISDQQKGNLRYWFEQFNVKESQEIMRLSSSTRTRLQYHFAKDAQLLASVTSATPTWS